MDITLLIIILILPFVGGALFLAFFFRRINKQYRMLFERLCTLARHKPLELQQHLAGHCSNSEEVVEILGRVLKIHKVEILKAGKVSTRLQLVVSINRVEELETLFIALNKTDDGEWIITSITLLNNHITAPRKAKETETHER